MRESQTIYADWLAIPMMDDPIAQPSRYQQATDQAHAYLKRPELHYTEEVLRWMVSGLVLMPPEALQALRQWLAHHERDIAAPTVWDDLGMLAGVFQAVMGREACASPHAPEPRSGRSPSGAPG